MVMNTRKLKLCVGVTATDGQLRRLVVHCRLRHYANPVHCEYTAVSI